MESNLENYLILRVSGVYGWALPFNRKNYVTQILNCSANHDKKSAATDVSYNPTYAPNLAPVLTELLEKGAHGIYHAAGEQTLSRYDFAMEVVDVFGLDRNIVQPVSYKTLYSNQTTKRPQHVSLSMAKLHKTVPARLWAPRQALEHMRTTEQEWGV
jgi:dTDP-4-dehydrorhamnose reductase